MSNKLKVSALGISIICLIFFGLKINTLYANTGQKKPIKIGWMAWTENEALMGVAKAVLEDKLGYEVKDVFLDVAVAYEAIAAGEIDVMFEVCVPNYHGNFWKKVSKDIFISGCSYTFSEAALYIPNYIPKDKVRSIYDLKKPEVRKKCRARIIAIDAGSGQNQITERTIKAYKLDYDLISGSEASNLAALRKAVDKKAWSVHSLWNPHYIWGLIDARPLEDPLGTMGFPDFAGTAVRINFMKDYPRVVGRFLARYHLPKSEICKIMIWIAEEKMSAVQAGRRYLKENPKRVHYWITGEIGE